MERNQITKSEIITKIEKLIQGLVQIEDHGECTFATEGKGTVSDKAWKDWNWAQGVALYGLYKYAKVMKSESAYAEIEEWFDELLQQEVKEKNINFMAPILTLAFVYEENHDESLVNHLRTWGDWAIKELPKTNFHGFQHTVFTTSNEGQLWDDTLMMAVLALAKIGVLLNEPGYIAEAERQFLVHTTFLMDRKTNLWFHGWSFDGNHNFGEALWARGNCWITIAIPELFDILGEKISLSTKLFLTDVLENQVKALILYQDKQGPWHTLINDNSSYIEISGTLGFAYGILKASHMEILTAEIYQEAGNRAVLGALSYIQDGKVANVSAGTGVGNNLEFYKKISLTDMPYGPALAILALTEYLNNL